MPAPCRVLIVDDSRIFRCALEEALRDLPNVEVVGSVWSGEKALESLPNLHPQIVTLDVEMPGLGGLATLRKIREWNAARPSTEEVGVLMVSAHTHSGAEVTIEALANGAFDFIPKPDARTSTENILSLRRQLAAKIALWQARRLPSPCGRADAVETSSSPIDLSVQAILIGGSTGGPAALAHLLPTLCVGTTLPIVIVQHMPAEFPHLTESLAACLAGKCSHGVKVARDGEFLMPRSIVIAPANRHLVLRRGTEQRLFTGLNDQPPENNCRPSVDVLFRSAAATLGGEAIGVLLTGMGCDGTAGLRSLKRAGAVILVQDEASSVVWGMPGSAFAAGLPDDVVPLDRLAQAILSRTAHR